MELTLAQIKDAQANDLDAVTAVIAATESRVANLARKAASRMGSRAADYTEEFTQVGRVAVWEAIPRFEGDNVDSFFAFMHRTVENTLRDSLRDERNPGSDHDALKVFREMLDLTDEDPFLAEKLAQTVPPKGKRLSADRANAARMAWQGHVSMDVPVTNTGRSSYTFNAGGTANMSLAELLADSLGVPEDLIETADLNAEDKRVKHAIVHAILDTMAPVQADSLRLSYGIGDRECFGTGDAGDLEGLAEALGVTPIQARDARSRGHKGFAKRYIKAVAKDDETTQALTEAAAQNLSGRGRK